MPFQDGAPRYKRGDARGKRERGNHVSARNPAAEAAYQEKINERLARGQAKVVPEEDIKETRKAADDFTTSNGAT